MLNINKMYEIYELNKLSINYTILYSIKIIHKSIKTKIEHVLIRVFDGDGILIGHIVLDLITKKARMNFKKNK